MKTFNILMAIVAGISLATITSCDSFHGVEGNHQVITEVRNISGFREVHSSGEYAVEINHDSVFSVEIEAEENLLPYIDTEISGDVLHLGVQGNHNLKPNATIHIRIRMPELTAVKLSGSGSIVTDTFSVHQMNADISGSGYIDLCTHADILNADISGSGSMDISGSAGQSELHISGSGDMHAMNAPCNDCNARISGSGSIYVQVYNNLFVDISGSGSVYYTGQPAVTTSISGSGRVIHQ